MDDEVYLFPKPLTGVAPAPAPVVDAVDAGLLPATVADPPPKLNPAEGAAVLAACAEQFSVSLILLLLSAHHHLPFSAYLFRQCCDYCSY